jgi:hypothetical protein
MSLTNCVRQKVYFSRAAGVSLQKNKDFGRGQVKTLFLVGMQASLSLLLHLLFAGFA